MLFNGFKGNIALITQFVEEALKYILISRMKELLLPVGIIKNTDGQVLTIFRRGFWDLPKGKVEPGREN